MKPFYCLSAILILIMACEKEKPEPPTGFISKITIEADQPVTVGYRSATIPGSLGDTYGQTVQDYGHCWDTLTDPDTDDDHSAYGTQKGAKSFSTDLIELKPGKQYHARAYFILGGEVKFSQSISFTTTALGLPLVQTKPISEIKISGATTGGIVTHDGGDPIIERGICWNTATNPSIENNHKAVGSAGIGAYDLVLSGLSPSTTYYVRAYATNALGIAYAANEEHFTTGAIPSVDFTATPTRINEGESVQFTDLSTNSPTSWIWTFGDGGSSTLQHPAHTYEMAGVYSVTLTVDNGYGTNTKTKTGFVTVVLPGSPPVAAFIASKTIVGIGESVFFTDQSANEPTIWSWDFGDGYTSTQQNPSHTYSQTGYYTITLTVTNSHGSDTKTRANYISVQEELSGVFQDIRDGNAYPWVKIGNQIWMAKNLAYLPFVNPASEGSNSSPHYYVYNNTGTNVTAAKDLANYLAYGVLYNYAAAMNACPEGWHLPSDAEWKELELFMGMSPGEVDDISYRGTLEGQKLKSLSGWNSNGNGTDYYGFNGLGGGWRDNSGVFLGIGDWGYWRTASQENVSSAWIRGLVYFSGGIIRDLSVKQDGFSVRCIKD